MLTKLSKVNAADLFLPAYGMYVLFCILSDSLLPVGPLKKPVYLGIILISIWILYLNYRDNSISRKRLFFGILLQILFTAASYITDRDYLVICGMLINASGNTDFDKIVKTSLISSVIASAVVELLVILNRLPDYIYVDGDRAAHCLGFPYYSYLPFIVFYCLVMYLYVRKKTSWIELGALFAVNNYMYSLSTIRLTYLLGIFVLALYVIQIRFGLTDISKKLFRYLSVTLFPALTVCTFFIMKNYKGTGLWKKMNSLLSRRLELMNRGFIKYPIRLFGQKIEMLGNNAGRVIDNYFYIDSGYAYSLLGYGIVFTVLIIFMYSVIYYYCCKNNKKKLFIWITAVALFTMINNTWITLEYNPLLFLFFPVFRDLFESGNDNQSDVLNMKEITADDR